MYNVRSGNKYHAKSTMYNGSHYDSKAEAAYAQELDLRVKAKDIKSWVRQVKLSLNVAGSHICDYYIDFVITHNDGTQEFLEVKGFSQPLWRLKWKLFEALFEDFKRTPDDYMTVIKPSQWR